MKANQKLHWNSGIKRHITSYKRQLANRLNRKFSEFSSNQNKIFLAVICLSFSTVCTYLIFKAII